MPHITLPEGLQGIRGPMAFRPETAKPLNELAEALLHAPNSLPQADRELIATYVSSLNDCYFCQTVHGSIAAACLDGDEDIIGSTGEARFHTRQYFEEAQSAPRDRGQSTKRRQA